MVPGKSLSLRSQLVILLLLASIISIAVIGYQGYRSGKDALSKAIVNQLTTLREAKTEQIKAAFSDAHDQVLAFAENHTIIAALNEFRTAYQLSERESISEDQHKQIEKYYRTEFIPRYKERMGGEPEVKHFIPESNAATYLQYHYMVNNPNKVGEKDKLVHAEGEGGYYAQVHERYHENLRSLIKKFGYYDLFLIDHETGDIIYSVFKETDFATSLTRGPYASSNFATVAKEMMRTKERGKVTFQDFDIYTPSYGAPAAFVAITIFDGKNIAGILALQIPSSELNNVMTSNGEWEKSGMGKTGEVYLVGRNHLMRSDSRFLIQEHDRYLGMLHGIGMPKNEIDRIDKLNTSILFQPIQAETVDLALSGKTGVKEVIDYRGVDVLSAYAPLRIHGLDWVVLSEMDIEEINEPINEFRRQVLVYASILGIIITLLALFAANYFTRPIHALVSALRRVGEGEIDVSVAVTRNDELGELSSSFNTMVNGIKEQKKLIEERDQENDLLLQNILPGDIAQRMKAGEEQIVDHVPNVSVIFCVLTGLSNEDDHNNPEDAIRKLNHLVSGMDDAAEGHGIDKIKTIGDDYMAACGLTIPRLDHAKRAIEFAREIHHVVQRINREYDLKLELRVGIHSGSVLAGVVGGSRFVYDVWGTTVDVTNRICYEAKSGSVSITQDSYDQLTDTTGLMKSDQLNIDGLKTIQLWTFNFDQEDQNNA